MADKKISQLTAVTTPLGGTEVLPIVQSGSTKKVTVDEMIAAQLAANIVTEAGATRTLSAADNQKVIYCTSGSAVTITCAAGLGEGFNTTIIQGGAGKVTVAAGAATLVSYSSLFSTMGQYAVISLIAPVANTFIAAGNLGV
tara:strand:- start:1378 stop:1803 length:426 start_codon:yes stop_codon:yes gene_type:complete